MLDHRAGSAPIASTWDAGGGRRLLPLSLAPRFVMTPSSQEMESPAIPGQFTTVARLRESVQRINSSITHWMKAGGCLFREKQNLNRDIAKGPGEDTGDFVSCDTETFLPAGMSVCTLLQSACADGLLPCSTCSGRTFPILTHPLNRAAYA